jgi:hypothetical protein
MPMMRVVRSISQGNVEWNDTARGCKVQAQMREVVSADISFDRRDKKEGD